MSHGPNILALELASFAGWPALETVREGDWIARFANGYSKRANSIQSLDAEEGADFSERLGRMAQLYRDRDGAPVFRVTPLAGAGVVGALETQRWSAFEPSVVMTMPVGPKLRAISALTQLLEPTDEKWLDAQSMLNGFGDDERARFAAVIGQIEHRGCAIIAYNEALQVVAAAHVVLSDGIAFFYNLIVADEARGQGFGRATMTAGLNWALQAGAHTAALQVLADNDIAVALYGKMGFAPAYDYHYRRPEAGAL